MQLRRIISAQLLLRRPSPLLTQIADEAQPPRRHDERQCGDENHTAQQSTQHIHPRHE